LSLPNFLYVCCFPYENYVSCPFCHCYFVFCLLSVGRSLRPYRLCHVICRACHINFSLPWVAIKLIMGTNCETWSIISAGYMHRLWIFGSTNKPTLWVLRIVSIFLYTKKKLPLEVRPLFRLFILYTFLHF
jgi:hypothetical protein